MLSAVAANKEVRKLEAVIRKLKDEIDILRKTKSDLLSDI